MSAIVQLGLKYHSEKFGHFFTERTQTFAQFPDDDNDDSDSDSEEDEDIIVTGTPFELACKVHGQPKVVDMVRKCVAKYFVASSSATNTTKFDSIISRSRNAMNRLYYLQLWRTNRFIWTDYIFFLVIIQ